MVAVVRVYDIGQPTWRSVLCFRPQVRTFGDSKVTLSYKYYVQEEQEASVENDVISEDSLYFEWALKKWSHCSKPCGGGELTFPGH